MARIRIDRRRLRLHEIVVRFAKHNLNHCSKSLQTVRRPNDDDDGRGRRRLSLEP